MGQIKKIVPRRYRNKIVEAVDRKLPEGSIARNHFADGISITGTALVAAGTIIDFLGKKKMGATLRAVGETGDDLDGDAARRLGTAGRSGALLDATVDKVKVALELAVLWKHSVDAAHDPHLTDRRGRIGLIASKHALNAALNGYIQSTGREAASLEPGKVNAYVDAVTVALWGIADAAEKPAVRSTLNTIGNVVFAAGIATGAYAVAAYAREALVHAHDHRDVSESSKINAY